MDAAQTALKKELDEIEAVGAVVAKHIEQAALGLGIALQKIEAMRKRYGLIE